MKKAIAAGLIIAVTPLIVVLVDKAVASPPVAPLSPPVAPPPPMTPSPPVAPPPFTISGGKLKVFTKYLDVNQNTLIFSDFGSNFTFTKINHNYYTIETNYGYINLPSLTLTSSAVSTSVDINGAFATNEFYLCESPRSRCLTTSDNTFTQLIVSKRNVQGVPFTLVV